jgi:hypothetical protein
MHEQSRRPIIVIVINPPKQRQNNIQHGSTKLRLIVLVRKFDATEDTVHPALRGFRRKSGTSCIGGGVGMALWRERLMYDRFGLWWLAGRGTPAGAGVW